jgi:hypothetical protein
MGLLSSNRSDLRSNPEDRIVSLSSIAEHTAMPKYNFLLCNSRSRVKYPKSFHLTDIEAARQVGFRIARITREVVPQWNDLPSDQQKNFAVEVVNGAGQTVLTLPCKAAEDLTPATRHLNTKKPHQDCSNDGASEEGSSGGNIVNLTRLLDFSVRRST